MSEDQLKRLFEQNNSILFGQISRHVDQRIAEVMDELKQVRSTVDHIYILLDREAKQTETDEQERIALQHQVERHDGWIGQLADATNVKLVPEP